MKRKIIQMAGKTMVVSLPAEWVKRHGVKKGDEIEVEEKEKNLIISTNKEFPVGRVKINIIDLYPLVNRAIIESYRRGYDELEIRYDNPKCIKRELINELIGFEIIKQEETYCIIKDITGVSDKEFDNLLRRLFLVLMHMGKDVLDYFKKRDYAYLREKIILLDGDVNKFANFCLRYLNKKGYKEYNRTLAIFSILNHLEYIGDEYKKLSLYIANSKIKPNKELLNLLDKTNKLFELFYLFFYKTKKELAVELAKFRDKLQSDIQRLLKTKNDSGLIHILGVIQNLIIQMLGFQLTFISDI